MQKPFYCDLLDTSISIPLSSLATNSKYHNPLAPLSFLSSLIITTPPHASSKVWNPCSPSRRSISSFSSLTTCASRGPLFSSLTRVAMASSVPWASPWTYCFLGRGAVSLDLIGILDGRWLWVVVYLSIWGVSNPACEAVRGGYSFGVGTETFPFPLHPSGAEGRGGKEMFRILIWSFSEQGNQNEMEFKKTHLKSIDTF